MAGNRRPIFELHIRPMFRLLDQVHMTRLAAAKRIDFSDYDQVKAKHAKIIGFLSDPGPMPPPNTGGPWPREWIDLFVRWTETDFGRLATATATNLKLVLTAPDRYTLSCEVALPHPSSTAWFDILQARPESQVYSIVMEQGDNVAPSPSMVTIDERIRGPLSTSEVIVFDAVGEHKLPIPLSQT